MQIIGELEEEHRIIKTYLRVLEQVCLKLWRVQEADQGHLNFLADFLEAFIISTHQAKEEEGIFPALQQEGIPLDGGQLGSLLPDHREAMNQVRSLRAGAAAYLTSPVSGAYQFFQSSRYFGINYVSHLSKEESMLFPLCSWLLTPREEELSLLFREIENRNLPSADRHQLLEKLQLLEGIYCRG